MAKTTVIGVRMPEGDRDLMAQAAAQLATTKSQFLHAAGLSVARNLLKLKALEPLSEEREP